MREVLLVNKLILTGKSKVVCEYLSVTWQKIHAPFLLPSMVDALMMSSISGTDILLSLMFYHFIDFRFFCLSNHFRPRCKAPTDRL